MENFFGESLDLVITNLNFTDFKEEIIPVSIFMGSNKKLPYKDTILDGEKG